MIASVTRNSMLRPGRVNARQVYLRLGDRQIGNYHAHLNERTLRQVLVTLQLAGYEAVVRVGWDRATYVFATLLKYHPNLKILWRDPEGFRLPIVWTDQNDVMDRPGSAKTISVQYDYKPGLELGEGHYAMPYGMHPSIYTVYHSHRHLNEFREQPRRVRVLFAGLTHYAGDLPATLFGKVLRSEIIERLRSSNFVKVVRSLEEMNGILDRGYCNGMLLYTDASIPQKDWLRFVASADFFLCPPGIMMPMCHNIIEAMGVGTVPITNYPDWFLPPLTPVKNCVAFTTVDDLHSTLESIVSWPAEKVQRMRKEVIRYYADHLAPADWFKRVLDDPAQTVYVHVLEETEQHLRKLVMRNKSEFSEFSSPTQSWS